MCGVVGVLLPAGVCECKEAAVNGVVALGETDFGEDFSRCGVLFVSRNTH